MWHVEIFYFSSFEAIKYVFHIHFYYTYPQLTDPTSKAKWESFECYFTVNKYYNTSLAIYYMWLRVCGFRFSGGGNGNFAAMVVKVFWLSLWNGVALNVTYSVHVCASIFQEKLRHYNKILKICSQFGTHNKCYDGATYRQWTYVKVVWHWNIMPLVIGRYF